LASTQLSHACSAFLGGNRLRAALREGDFVQQPVGPAVIGDVFRAVGKTA